MISFDDHNLTSSFFLVRHCPVNAVMNPKTQSKWSAFDGLGASGAFSSCFLWRGPGASVAVNPVEERGRETEESRGRLYEGQRGRQRDYRSMGRERGERGRDRGREERRGRRIEERSQDGGSLIGDVTCQAPPPRASGGWPCRSSRVQEAPTSNGRAHSGLCHRAERTSPKFCRTESFLLFNEKRKQTPSWRGRPQRQQA